MGHMIPAGTGFRAYSEMGVRKIGEPPSKRGEAERLPQGEAVPPSPAETVGAELKDLLYGASGGKKPDDTAEETKEVETAEVETIEVETTEVETTEVETTEVETAEVEIAEVEVTKTEPVPEMGIVDEVAAVETVADVMDTTESVGVDPEDPKE